VLSLAQSSYSQPPDASPREGLLPGKQLIQAQGVHRASGLRAEEATLDGGDNLRFPSCDPAQSAGPRKIGQGKRISKRTYDYLLHGKEPANERGHTVPGTWLIEEHSAAAKEVSRAAKLAAAGGGR
jgi:hypothetical protein